jgi:hypothetical protein
MTLDRIEQQIGSIFSVEILHLALDNPQVVVLRENLKPQLFALVLLIFIVP